MADEQPTPKPEASDGEQGSRSAPFGLILLLVLGGLFVFHDQRTVGSARERHVTVSGAEEQIAGYATAAPDAAELEAVDGRLEAVVAAGGGADCSPLFGLLAREGTQKAARDNVGKALALLARLQVVRGDLDGARQAIQRYERETKDDYIPGDVEAWVWRIGELLDHPGAGDLEPSQLRAVLFAKAPVDQAIEGLEHPQ